MDNAQKAIMLGVGLFITIIVIAAVMAITGIGQDLLNQGQTQISGLSEQLSTQVKTDYDQKQFSGTQVKSIINKFYNDDTIAIYVARNTADFDYSKAFDITSSAYLCSQLKITNDAKLKITASGVSGTNASTTLADNKRLTSIGLTGVTIIQDNSSHPAISTLTSQLQATYKYKCVLITNDENGSVIGLYFVRFQ